MTGGIKSLPQCLLQSFRESPVGLVDFAFQLFTLSLLPEWIYQQYECHDHEAFISHLAGFEDDWDCGRCSFAEILNLDSASLTELDYHVLIWAAKHVGVTLIENRLRNYRDELRRAGYQGNKLLHIAVFCGSTDLAKLLLKYRKKLDPVLDYKDQDDRLDHTPLSWDAEKGHGTIVKLLLDKGADLESKSKFGRAPLSYAAENGHEAIVKLLLDKSTKEL